MDQDKLWRLFAKKKTGTASLEELAELESLIKSSSDDTADIIDKIWSTPIQSLPDMKAGSKVWSRIQNKINTKRPKRFFLYPAQWAAAAAVIIALAIGVVLWTRPQTAIDQAAVAQLERPNKIATDRSSKSKILLPDGTEVWLNGGSQISYASQSFSKRREVTLTGEAFFDVVKNPLVPFVIHAANINITVKGTAFNVKAYPEQKSVETTLIKGLIELTTTQDPERRILVKPNEKIVVPRTLKQPTAEKQDEQGVSLYTITRITKDKDNILAETAWMNKKLQFDNETFKDIVPKMESWFTVTIHITDPVIANKKFSALIEGETLETTLEAMRLSYPFNYIRKGSEVWISKE